MRLPSLAAVASAPLAFVLFFILELPQHILLAALNAFYLLAQAVIIFAFKPVSDAFCAMLPQKGILPCATSVRHRNSCLIAREEWVKPIVQDTRIRNTRALR